MSDGQAFLAASLAMVRLRVRAEEIARLDEPVLLLGESGTGKKLLARLIHHSSPRSLRRFACVRCCRVPEETLEAELFGHTSVAADGSLRFRKGLLEQCHHGTLLLEEFEQLPQRLQRRLLDVLDQKQLCRPGNLATAKADVRILAASSGDVSRALSRGALREDLYHRLKSLVLELPPLRERRDEIPVLLENLMQRTARRHGQHVPPLSDAVVEGCRQYAWPGNFCEFEQFATRFVLFGNEAKEVSGIAGVPQGAASEMKTFHAAAGRA